MNERYKKMFEEYESAIKILKQELQALEVLYGGMCDEKNKDVFDEEDLSYVTEEFAAKQTKLVELEEQYRKRQDFYKNGVTVIKEKAERRMQILDQYDKQYKVLRDNEELCKKFIRKQRDLKELEKEAETQLLN